jgi:hypothetical protein
MRKRIGYVTVETGQIMIIDPGLCELWDDARHYPQVCKLTAPQKKYGKLTIQDGMSAIVSWTVQGDGRYPVYVTMNSDGEIEKLEIVFEPIM